MRGGWNAPIGATDSNGNVVTQGRLRNVVRGQNLRADGVVFHLAPGAMFSRVAAETDCYTVPSGATALDGGYNLHSSDGNMPPIIRGGFMIPTGKERAQELDISMSCGLSMDPATLSQAILAMKCSLRAYLLNMVTQVRVPVFRQDIYGAHRAQTGPANALIWDHWGTLAPSSLDSGFVWNTRSHQRSEAANGGNAAAVSDLGEEYPYPKIDWSVDQALIITQQWDSGYPQGIFYFNSLVVEAR